jgi:branched-chain amino acid transport system substrate-binding protein
MKYIKNYSIIILLFITACNNNNNVKNKIGIIAPLTGEGATYGDAMKKGFDLAFSKNKNFQLVYEDSKLSTKEGVNAINKLISLDKVKVIYGAASSSVTLAIAPEAEKNKVILFSSISTADDIKNSGDFIFRNVPSNHVQGETAANFLINKLGKKNIAILMENDDYGISLSESFKEKVIQLGGKISLDETYTSSDVDFRTQLIKIKKSNPDALFIPGNYEESALILKQAKELNIDIPIIGGDGSFSERLIKVAGKSSEGFYCTHFEIDKNSSFYKDFKLKFIKKYNKVPNVYEAYAYEAGKILLETLEDTPYDATIIKNKLYKNHFESLTGELIFDENGDVQREFGILQIINGEFISIIK